MPKLQNLVLEGGGVHGIAYIGALKHLQQQGMRKVDRVAGASIGTLMAVAVACQVPADQLFIDANTLTPEIMTGGIGKIRAAYGFVVKRGMYDMKKRGKPWLEHLVRRWAGAPDVTLHDLRAKFETDVYMVLYNSTRGRSEVIGPETHPHVKVVDAVMASLSFPGVFRPQKVPGMGNDLYIDGGIINNFPLYLFDDEKYGGTNNYNNCTLGLRTVSERSTYFGSLIGFSPPQPRTFIEYYTGILNVMVESGQQRYEKPRDAKRTCFLKMPHDLGSLDFGITAEQRQQLFNDGMAQLEGSGLRFTFL